METMTISKEQLQAALHQWEQDCRDGKTLSREETQGQPVEQVAAASTEHLWRALQAAA